MSDIGGEMNTLIFTFNEKEAKHRQIYQRIREEIESGQLAANSHLPSIRKLAEKLNISRNTTLQAYEQLVAEGYIKSEPKKGYYVQELEPLYMDHELYEPLPNSMKKEEFLIDFRTGIVDQSAFPLTEWRQCANKVLKDEMVYGYCDPLGDDELREQLSKYLMHSRGLRTNPEAIVIGGSTQFLLLQLSILFKGDFEGLAVENPGYDGARKVFELQGFHIEPIQVTETGISIKALTKTKNRLVYLTPSHQFPIGTSIPVPERQQLIKWAKEREGYIIEDDYDSEFRYKQHPIPALAALDPDGNIIYIGTFSKSFLPAIRISYMVLPTLLLKNYREKMMLIEQSASSLHQRTMAMFMKNGYWESHLRRMRKKYKAKMYVLTQSLQKAFDKQMEIIGNESGLYILIRVHTDLNEAMLILKAKNYGVKVYPTKPYFLEDYPESPLLQLGFANLTIEQIYEGVNRLKKAWF